MLLTADMRHAAGRVCTKHTMGVKVTSAPKGDMAAGDVKIDGDMRIGVCMLLGVILAARKQGVELTQS